MSKATKNRSPISIGPEGAIFSNEEKQAEIEERRVKGIKDFIEGFTAERWVRSGDCDLLGYLELPPESGGEQEIPVPPTVVAGLEQIDDAYFLYLVGQYLRNFGIDAFTSLKNLKNEVSSEILRYPNSGFIINYWRNIIRYYRGEVSAGHINQEEDIETFIGDMNKWPPEVLEKLYGWIFTETLVEYTGEQSKYIEENTNFENLLFGYIIEKIKLHDSRRGRYGLKSELPPYWNEDVSAYMASREYWKIPVVTGAADREALRLWAGLFGLQLLKYIKEQPLFSQEKVRLVALEVFQALLNGSLASRLSSLLKSQNFYSEIDPSMLRQVLDNRYGVFAEEVEVDFFVGEIQRILKTGRLEQFFDDIPKVSYKILYLAVLLGILIGDLNYEEDEKNVNLREEGSEESGNYYKAYNEEEGIEERKRSPRKGIRDRLKKVLKAFLGK